MAEVQDAIYDYEVEEADAGERIDKFLTQMEEGWSRTQVQKWIKEGRVTVDGKEVKANYRLEAGQTVLLKVPPPVEMKILPEPIPLNIVHEDRDVIVVDKPRGLVVHPGPGNHSGTLVNALLHHCQDLSGINGVLRPGIVHRLDKDTSGLLVVAKNDKAHVALARQLKEHTVKRKYIALVHGVLPHERGTIDAPISRDPRDRKKMAVVPKNGKPAVTHFAVLERLPAHTLVECRLETGRTHQIRVHMQYIGHPVVGDPKYGRGKSLGMEGQALHAATLGFIHPRTAQYLEFSSPLPEDMEALLSRLRRMK